MKKFTKAVYWRYSTLLLFLIAVSLVLNNKSLAEEIISHPLKATISLDKTEYLINEGIWLTIILENVSKEKIIGTSADPVRGLIRIEVLTENGDTIAGGCIKGLSGGCPTLDPGQKDIDFVNIIGGLCNYGVPDDNALRKYRGLLQEGRYFMQAKARYIYEGKTVSILTNKLEFMVKSTGTKEKIPYQLLLDGSRLIFPKESRNEGKALLMRIIEEYPKSAYVETAYEFLLHLFYHDREFFDHFIKNYPNSGVVGIALNAIALTENRTLERKKFLQDIIEKHPNTKAAIFAEIYLDKWRRGKIWVDEPID